MFQEIILFFLPFFIFFLIWFYSKKPTNNKDWKQDVSRFSNISIQKNTVLIQNFRDFIYIDENNFKENFSKKTFNINDIIGLDYIIEPFSKFQGIAHTLLSFKLKNGKYICASVEVRKIKDQEFSLLKTFFRNYELIYIFGSEEDLIKLRTNIRKDTLFLFPIDADKNFIQSLFVDMIRRSSSLQKNPEFYHPWFNSCTTNLIDHVNNILPYQKRIRFGFSKFLPGYTNTALFKLHYVLNGNLHENDLEYYRIDRKAQYFGKGNFSKHIREGIN